MANKAKPPGGDKPEDDDARLWEAVAKSVTPIAKTNTVPDTEKRDRPAPVSHSPRTQLRQQPVDLSDFSIGGKGDGAQSPPPAPCTNDLVHGDAPGVDRRTAEKFRRGLMPIEATLDLHGHSQETGRQALKTFIQAHQAAGRRCVLVITGKGLKEDWSVGVLRSALPQWLNSGEFRKLILAFSYAQPHHGGSGAVYILLRRNR